VTSHDTPETRRGTQQIGLLLGPILAVAVYAAMPTGAADRHAGLAESGPVVTAIAVLMAVYWVTEALPIPATALLPMVLFPLLTGGRISIRAAAAPYAHELIFLFMGGFMLAMAMQRWGLHRRIALNTVLLMGARPTSIVGGFMAASAFLSLWVSNTATVVMMYPIAASVVEVVRRQLATEDPRHEALCGSPFPFAVCLLLGTAYGASIGGVGTLIGTPPNLLLAAYLKEQFGLEITFVRWMAVGLPFVVVFLPLTWLLLTRWIYPVRLTAIPGGRQTIREELLRQGPMTRGEWIVLVVFVATALAWIFRPLIAELELPSGVKPFRGLSDAAIALAASLVLFACPVEPRRGVFALDWADTRSLPWGVLILFGGGLSLAAGLNDTGVADYIGQGVSSLRDVPPLVLVAVVTTTIVFLTELTSNTATTATFLPILGAVAMGLQLPPPLLVVPATIAASCAFMMPVATPPNAIIFASGEVTVAQMCRAGFWLNLVSIGLIVLLVYALGVRVLLPAGEAL